MARRTRGPRDATQTEFDAFVLAETPGLLRSAYLVVWDLRLAEDLVQECLFRIARRWQRVRVMESPRAYARKVLFHLALAGKARHVRHRGELGKSGEGYELERRDDAADRAIQLVDSTFQLRAALATLSPRRRAALVLRFLDDMSEADAAALLGCSVGTVKSTTSRALDQLQASIDRWDGPAPDAIDDGGNEINEERRLENERAIGD